MGGDQWLMKGKREHFLSICSWQISSIWHSLLSSSKDLLKMVSFFEASSNLPYFQNCFSWESWNSPDFLPFWMDTLPGLYLDMCCLSVASSIWLYNTVRALFTWFLFSKCAQNILVFEVIRTLCKHWRKPSRICVLMTFYKWKLLLGKPSYLYINQFKLLWEDSGEAEIVEGE